MRSIRSALGWTWKVGTRHGLSVLIPFLLVGDLAAQVDGVQFPWDTLTIRDDVRQRTIPIAIIRPTTSSEPQGVVLISHGYNENQPGTYLLYSAIAQGLANAGYVAVSVQHELPGDAPLAMKGDLRRLRQSNWERGVENLRAVVRVLHELEPRWSLARVDLIGHSNGGDISMLFATNYPSEVRTAISLDNRRMPLPRTSEPHIASLRANDAAADPGVLPDAAEQARYGIDVINMQYFKHVDFNDRATVEQRKALMDVLLRLLNEVGR